MERRRFLRDTVGGLGALNTFRGSKAQQVHSPSPIVSNASADFPSDGYRVPEWAHYAQTVYFDGYSPPVYPHMKDFDAKRLVDVVAELGGNLLRFQPIGYWAYYPSKAFPVHPELGGRDLITEVAGECRRRNIHLYCYTGYGSPHMELGWVDQHPEYADWALRDPQGKPYGTYSHIGWTLLQKPCTTGDAYRAGVRQVVRELCEHDIDGVYFDSPSEFSYTGVCFCDSCRRGFREFTGMDIDRLSWLVKYGGLPYDWSAVTGDVDMEAVAAWYRWANELTKEDLLEFRRIIHGSGKFMFCHNWGTWLGPSLPLQYHIPDGFMVEASKEIYDRLMTGLRGASMTRPYNKVAQMYLGGYGTSWFGEPPHERPWAVHNTNLEDEDEIRMEGFANLACGNIPLYATANRLYFKVGSGSAKPGQEVFEFMRRVEPINKASVPVPYISIVATWESLQLWRTRRKSWNWPMMSEAMGLAMLDERISVDVNASPEISQDWLKAQRVIALCGASGISDRDAGLLARWVESGGGLLATYDTGLCDEQGQVRKDGGALRQVLGVAIQGEPLPSQPECYYRVKQSHPALGGYSAGSIVQGDGRLLPVTAAAGAQVLAECWNLGTDEVRGPAIVSNSYGKGRTIYINGSLEAYYVASRARSTGRLLGSIVRYLGGTPLPYTLKAPRGVYAILRQATNGDLVLWLLGNVGFKDADAGRMRQEYLSVSDVEVGIRVPEGRRANAMQLMRADHTVPFEVVDGYAVAALPSFHIGEVVRLELD
jgi:hypothetical protein